MCYQSAIEYNTLCISRNETEAQFKLSLVIEVSRKRIRVAHARADNQDLEPARARREVLGGDAFESRGAPRGVQQDEPAPLSVL